MSNMKVAVIGAGLGGLCLAQSLRRRDIQVEVFERDMTAFDRPQGYRLHLDSDGIGAVHEALPAELNALFDATSMRPLAFTTIVDTSFELQRRIPDDQHGGTQGNSLQGKAAHMNVNRATLREILLTGLDDCVHFGKSLSRYESDKHGVVAHFQDGTRVNCDLLVGADGIRSQVRRQRLPAAVVQDSGIRAIYGRVPLTEAVKLVSKQVLGDTFTVVLDAKKLFLGLGPVIFPARPEVAASKIMPTARLRAQGDYLACIVGGRKALFGQDDSRLAELHSNELRHLSVDLLKGWPEVSSAIPGRGDPESFFFVEMYTSVPCKIPRALNVTLLGDAIHAMTPTLGRGANIAMRDAALLARHISDVAQGSRSIADSLSAFEKELASHGFDAVTKSAQMGVRLIGQNPLP